MDDRGWWTASVPDFPGCHTQGRSLRQARNRLDDVLSLFVDDPKTIELHHDVLLPRDTALTVAAVQRLREETGAAQERVQALTAAVAQKLGRKGVSLRDAAELLGVSHQRLHQQMGARSQKIESARKGPWFRLASLQPPPEEWMQKFESVALGTEPDVNMAAVTFASEAPLPGSVSYEPALSKLLTELTPMAQVVLLGTLAAPPAEMAAAIGELTTQPKQRPWAEILMGLGRLGAREEAIDLLMDAVSLSTQE